MKIEDMIKLLILVDICLLIQNNTQNKCFLNKDTQCLICIFHRQEMTCSSLGILIKEGNDLFNHTVNTF